MKEPCAIYSTRCLPFSVEEICDWADGATVRSDGEGTTWKTISAEWQGCTMTINRSAPDGLLQHLEGLRGYVWKCGGGEMTQSLYALIQRSYMVRHSFGTMSVPSITAPAERFLHRLAGEGFGFLFRGNNLINPRGQIVIGPEGERIGHLIDWPDAIQRKKATTEHLLTLGLRVPESLPPVPGQSEVQLRSPQEVACRALALYAVASHAVPDGISRAKAWSLLENQSILSPKEHAFLKSLFPGNVTRIQFAWRFESLWTLLWALGLVDDLGLPSAVKEVSSIDAVLDQLGIPALLAMNRLRPTNELLDHLDLVYRCHWVTTNARLKNQPSPEVLDAGVVMERHYALNWLTCHQHRDWDDVNTDT